MGSAVPGVVHDDQRVPLPRPKPVPRAHTTPLLPADLGQERWLKHGGGEKRGGVESGDRQTDVGLGVGREAVGAVLARLEVAEERRWGREGTGAGWSWDVR